MDKLLHALAVLVATLSHVHPAPPGTLTDGHQHDAGLATYGGVSAWWGEHLMVRTKQGKVMALPPMLSEDAETVDVGRGPDGAVWVTYARCPGATSSCRAYAYNMKTRRERPLGVGQAVAAAVDGTEVAWFRETQRYGPSQLLVGSLAAPGGVARRVKLPKIEWEPVAQPLALDPRGGRLAYAANQGGDDVRAEALRAGTPGDMISISEDGGYGEECTRVEVAPTITPGALTWLRSTIGTTSCGRRHATLTRRRWADGALSHAEVPAKAVKQALVTGGRILALAPSRTDGDQGDRDACEPGGAPVGCVARLLPAPRWLAGRGS